MKLDFSNVGKGLEAIATAKRERDYREAVEEKKKEREARAARAKAEPVKGTTTPTPMTGVTPIETGLSSITGREGLAGREFYGIDQAPRDYYALPGDEARYTTREEALAARPEAPTEYQRYLDRADLAEEYGFYDRAKDLRTQGLEMQKQAQLSDYYGTQTKVAQAKLLEQERDTARRDAYDKSLAAAMQIKDPMEQINAMVEAETIFSGPKAGTDLFNTLYTGYEKGMLPGDWQRQFFDAKNNALAIDAAFRSNDYQGMLAPFDFAAGDGVDFKIYETKDGKFAVGKFEIDPNTGQMSEVPAETLSQFGAHSTMAGLAKRLKDNFGGVTDVYNAQVAANKLVDETMKNYVEIAGDLSVRAKTAYEQGNTEEGNRLMANAQQFQDIIDAHYLGKGGLSGGMNPNVPSALDELRPTVPQAGGANVEAGTPQPEPTPTPTPEPTTQSVKGNQLPADYIMDYLRSVATSDGQLDLKQIWERGVAGAEAKIPPEKERVPGTGEGFNYVPKNQEEVNAWLDEYAPEWYDRGFRSAAQNEQFVKQMQEGTYRQKGVPGLRGGGLIRGYKMGGKIPRFADGSPGSVIAKAKESMSYINDPKERADQIKQAKANADAVKSKNAEAKADKQEKLSAISSMREGLKPASGGGVGEGFDTGYGDFGDAMGMLASSRIQAPQMAAVDPNEYLRYMQARRGGGLIHDYRRGGHTADKGTETSDSILARVSKNEYVVNAESMKIPGVPELLEAINTMGLQKRRAKAARKPRAKKKTTATRKA
jgi:hypothetical protein